MATLDTLVAQGALVKIEVHLEPMELQDRVIYGTPRFIQWLSNELPQLGSSWNIFETPSDQMDVLMHEFITGGPMPYERRFKPWWRTEDGVWYLKSADLRVFGWFPKLDHFIASNAGTAEIAKTYKLYSRFVNSVVETRDKLDLDKPKFVGGSNPDDVLSIHD